MPRPKWYCQMRLTITRAVSGLSGEAIQSASTRRRPGTCAPGVGVGITGLRRCRAPTGSAGSTLSPLIVRVAAEQHERLGAPRARLGHAQRRRRRSAAGFAARRSCLRQRRGSGRPVWRPRQLSSPCSRIARRVLVSCLTVDRSPPWSRCGGSRSRSRRSGARTCVRAGVALARAWPRWRPRRSVRRRTAALRRSGRRCGSG